MSNETNKPIVGESSRQAASEWLDDPKIIRKILSKEDLANLRKEWRRMQARIIELEMLQTSIDNPQDS